MITNTMDKELIDEIVIVLQAFGINRSSPIYVHKI